MSQFKHLRAENSRDAVHLQSEDARACMDIYRSYEAEWEGEKYVEKCVRKITQVALS